MLRGARRPGSFVALAVVVRLSGQQGGRVRGAKHRVAHVQGACQQLVCSPREAHVRHLRDDLGEHAVIEVDVLVLAPWSEGEPLAELVLDRLDAVGRAVQPERPLGRSGVRRRVGRILEARRHGEDLSKRDIPDPRVDGRRAVGPAQRREDRRERLHRERELPLVDELPGDRRGQRLGDAPEPEHRGRRGLLLGRQVRIAEAVVENDLSFISDRKRGAGKLVRAHDLLGGGDPRLHAHRHGGTGDRDARGGGGRVHLLQHGRPGGAERRWRDAYGEERGETERRDYKKSTPSPV